MNDSLVRYDVAPNAKELSMTLSKYDDKNWGATFSYKRGRV